MGFNELNGFNGWMLREEGSSATRGVRDLMDVTDLIDRMKN